MVLGNRKMILGWPKIILDVAKRQKTFLLGAGPLAYLATHKVLDPKTFLLGASPLAYLATHKVLDPKTFLLGAGPLAYLATQQSARPKNLRFTD